MPDPDFGGLRTAVEDAAVRAPFESLRARAAARRRRRVGLTAAGAAALTALAVVAVPRTGPAPEPGFTSAPTEAAVPTPGPPGVPPVVMVAIAFGRSTAYALLGDCPGTAPTCTYRLVASPDAGRTWTTLPSPLPALSGNEGFSAELLVTGDDDLTVLDRARRRAYASTDRGRSFAERVLRDGPPIDAVPPGLRVEQTWCDGDDCSPARLVVFDPATGRTSPLRAQPVTGSTMLAVATGDDGRIWVAGQDRDGVALALSGDRGRTWQALPTPAGIGRVRLMRLVPLPGRGAGAFLLTGREDEQDVLNAFSDLWRLDDADPRWVRVTPPGAPRSALTAVGLSDGELLLTAEGGGLWRTSDRGERIARDPDPQVGGLALPLATVSRSGSLLIARSDVTDLDNDLELLVSADEGRTWDRRPLPPR